MTRPGLPLPLALPAAACLRQSRVQVSAAPVAGRPTTCARGRWDGFRAEPPIEETQLLLLLLLPASGGLCNCAAV